MSEGTPNSAKPQGIAERMLACWNIPRLTAAQLKVAQYLAFCDGPNGVFPSAANIEAETGIPRRRVFYALKHLESIGAISRDKRRGTSTVYTLHYGRWNELVPTGGTTLQVPKGGTSTSADGGHPTSADGGHPTSADGGHPEQRSNQKITRRVNPNSLVPAEQGERPTPAKVRYDQRRAAGLCVRCGEPAGGYSLCARHRAAARQAVKDHAERERELPWVLLGFADSRHGRNHWCEWRQEVGDVVNTMTLAKQRASAAAFRNRMGYGGGNSHTEPESTPGDLGAKVLRFHPSRISVVAHEKFPLEPHELTGDPDENWRRFAQRAGQIMRRKAETVAALKRGGQ